MFTFTGRFTFDGCVEILTDPDFDPELVEIALCAFFNVTREGIIRARQPGRYVVILTGRKTRVEVDA